MKVQATVLVTLQATSLANAGEILDDVLTRAHKRDDMDVRRVEIVSPPAERAVTLPSVPSAGGSLHESPVSSHARDGS
jgi:hypothetical protein